ncbi:Mbov_0396 family ICE element transmembrane protein [Mycoplasmopsis agalactiae]|uniref:Mbov_0396 family ICE element transmembrane protein n=1 Tax=Mycoplasmopsis agalactiae TaxID=2110 RepID=UPI001F1F0DB9|nr:hypothetical protein [Mycoplasmopsis agalactiae]MCE6114579.1 hypothetical protein [Mycoplasmopsis agalactiae]
MFARLGYAIWLGLFNVTVRLPLWLLDSVVRIYKMITFALPSYLLFGISPGESFANAQLPILFLRMAIISFFVFAILFALSAVKVQFQKSDQPSPISIAMKNSLLGTLFLIGTPIALYVFSILISILVDLVLGGNVSLGQSIFDSLYDKAWADKGVSFATWSKPDSEYGSYWVTYSTYSKLPSGANAQSWFMGTILSIGSLVPMVLGIITVIQKIFQQFFLFVISPFIVAASVSDDGKRMKQFIEMYSTKSFAIIGMLIGLQMLTVWITKTTQWSNTLDINFLERFLMNIALIIGGVISVMSLTSVIAAFAGESASVRETMAETKGTIAAGAGLLAGGMIAGKFGKKLLGGAASPAKGIMNKTHAGRSFLENISEKRNINKNFKAGRTTLKQRNEALEALKAQKQAEKVNKLKLRDQKQADLRLKSQLDGPVALSNVANDSPNFNSISPSPALNNAIPTGLNASDNSLVTNANVSNNAVNNANLQTDKSYLKELSNKDIKSSGGLLQHKANVASRVARRKDKEEKRLTKSISKNKNKLDKTNNKLENKLLKTQEKLLKAKNTKEENKLNKVFDKTKNKLDKTNVKLDNKLNKQEAQLDKTKKTKEKAIRRTTALSAMQEDRKKFYTSAQNRNLFTRNSSSNVDDNAGAYKLSKITDNKKWSDIDKQDKANETASQKQAETVNSNTNSNSSNKEIEESKNSNSSNSNTDKEKANKSKDNKEIKNLVEKNAKEVKRINDELETLKLNDIKEKSKRKKGK